MYSLCDNLFDCYSSSNENSLLPPAERPTLREEEDDDQSIKTVSSLGSTTSNRSEYNIFLDFIREAERPGSNVGIATLSSMLDGKESNVPRYELGVFYGRDLCVKMIYGYRQAFSMASAVDINTAFINGNYGHVLMRNDADEIAQYRTDFIK